jgi:hypothetical protein
MKAAALWPKNEGIVVVPLVWTIHTAQPSASGIASTWRTAPASTSTFNFRICMNRFYYFDGLNC